MMEWTMADLSITFTNMSAATFKRSAYGKLEAIVDTNAALPDETMKPREMQIFAINNETFVGEGAALFWCCWLDEETSARFGVKIRDDGQPFGMGWQPSWQVMSDHGPDGQEPSWTDNGSDPGNSYTWDQAVGFQIKATAVAAHETLAVSVLILDLPKK